MPTLPRRLGAEGLGTLLLVAIVVGSGVMGSRLTHDSAVVLLVNAVATVAGLAVLIAVLGPLSGAHFNPVVSAVAALRREVPMTEALGYILAQVIGAVLGALLANAMFGLSPLGASTHIRSGAPLFLGEVIATAGLLLVIGALTRTGRAHLGPLLVPAWIGAAYFFTSSTSFANPAVTIGRAFSDSFAGIAPTSVPMFIVMQCVGAAIGALATEALFPRHGMAPEPLDLPLPVHHDPQP